MAPRGDTRTRMLHSAVRLMQRDGAAAVTVDAVLADSGAPRGSVYHHFPGGRDQIIHDALRFAGDTMTAMIGATTGSPLDTLDPFIDFWKDMVVRSDFTAGCPIAGAAVSGAQTDTEVHQQVAGVFAEWHRLIEKNLTDVDVAPARARSITTMIVAAVEGALILARIERSVTPLDDVSGEVRRILESVLLPA